MLCYANSTCIPLIMIEKDLERWLVKECRKWRIHCRKWTSPSQRGVPDRILVFNGKVLFLELKAPGEEPSPLQRWEMKCLAEAGAWVEWTDNVYDTQLLLVSLCPNYAP